MDPTTMAVRKIIVTGLTIALTVTQPLSAVAKVKSNWSRVLKIKPGTKTTVVLYTDRAPQGKSEVKGHFHSATPGCITVTLKRGQTRTLGKQAVYQVLVDRIPYEGLITAGATTGIFLALAPRWERWELDGGSWVLLLGLLVGLPTGTAFLVSPKTKTIYYVSRKLRDEAALESQPPATKQGSNTSGSGLLLLEDKAFGPELSKSQTGRPRLREKLLLDLSIPPRINSVRLRQDLSLDVSLLPINGAQTD